MTKRIALIRNSQAYDIGGAEIFPVSLGKILDSHGFETFLLSSNKKTAAMAEAAGLNTSNSPWWSYQNFSGLGLLLFPMYLLWVSAVTLWYFVFFLRNGIDIVHPQSRDDLLRLLLQQNCLTEK